MQKGWGVSRRVQKHERHRTLDAQRRSRDRRDEPTARRFGERRAPSGIPGTGPSAGAHRLLRGFAVVVVEQAAQPLATVDASLTTSDAIVRFNQPVIEALMIALSMIMRNEFADRSAKRLLAEVLLEQVGDSGLLVTVDPTSDGDRKECPGVTRDTHDGGF